MKREIVLIVDNVRSCHNVGSFFRTAEGLGVKKLLLCGITPYPKLAHDERMPHIAEKADRQIAKTALGSQDLVTWEHQTNIVEALNNLRRQGFQIIALEQTDLSVDLIKITPDSKVALIVGNELEGVSVAALKQSDLHTEISMSGKKESLNVAVAAGIALFYLSTV